MVIYVEKSLKNQRLRVGKTEKDFYKIPLVNCDGEIFGCTDDGAVLHTHYLVHL